MVEAGNIQEVSHMLKHTSGLNIDIIGPKFRESPLIVAINNGDIEMMKLLIDHGADCNLKCPDALRLGHTPLFFAARTFSACGLDMMKILIAHGASATVVGERGDTGMHLLFSIHLGNPSDADKRLRLLLDNIPNKDINRLLLQRDWYGNTASDLNRLANAASLADMLDMEVQIRRDSWNQWMSKRRAMTDALREDSQSPIRILEADMLNYIISLFDEGVDRYRT